MPRTPRKSLAPLLVLAAACTDRTPTAVPVPVPPPGGAALIACEADVRALAVSCTAAEPRLAGGASAAVLGGQGVNVRLRNTGVAYEDGIFRTDVTVENLVAQALGTADGVTPSPDGVRVYFQIAPRASRGEGEVSIANADGQAFFTEAGQDFFRYDGILAPGDTSPPRQWRFGLPASVQGFTFQVYVAGAVAHEVGWIGVSPAMPALAVGETTQLAGTVHGVSGRPLPGHVVSWSTSDSAVVRVAPDGTVTGVSLGFAAVTATSNGRTGRAVVHVGSASGDGVPPTVRALSFSPARVDANGADSVTVEVRVADAGTGVASVAVGFRSPAAEHGTTCFAFAPVSGTRADGVFRCRVGIRPRSEGGVWSVRYVEVADRAGNGQSADTDQLDDAHVPTSLYVRSANPDLVAPAFAAVRVSPDSVVAGGADSVRVEMRLADAGIGVHFADARFTSPSGAQSVPCAAAAPDSGTVHDGVFACRVAVAAGAEPGEWTLAVSATDSLGNVRSLSAGQLQAAGFPSRLRVSSASSDVTPPVLTGFSFAPGTVAASGADSVTVTMQLADAGVGVQQASVAFASPSRSTSATCHALAPVSGTRGAGTFQCRLAVPAGAETGAWELTYLQAYDSVGNTTTLTRADVEAAGHPATLNVTS